MSMSSQSNPASPMISAEDRTAEWSHPPTVCPAGLEIALDAIVDELPVIPDLPHGRAESHRLERGQRVQDHLADDSEALRRDLFKRIARRVPGRSKSNVG